MIRPRVALLAYQVEHLLEYRRWADEVPTTSGKLPGWEFEMRSVSVEHAVDNVTLPIGPQGAPQRIEMPAGPTLILVAEPQVEDSFGSVADARAALEPMLRAWEAHFELIDRGFPVAFEFAFGVLEDGAAPDPGQSRVAEYATDEPGGLVVRKLELLAPPPPPTWFSTVPPLVDELRLSWRKVAAGRALTSDRAYWCLTLLEATYQGRRGAAAALLVDITILNTIGRLAAAEDRAQGRKVGGRGPTVIRYEDEIWLRAALPRLILRVAEVELGASDIARLQMTDLPQL